MRIMLNGDKLDNLPVDINIQQLLHRLGLPVNKIAVECNREIIPRAHYEHQVIYAGDNIEIIHFIGGG